MNEGAAAMPLAPQGGPAGPVGREELSEGLMLVRASTIKVVRLQLAMERRDRRTVLETVDDLVMLDGRLRDFLEKMPADKHVGPMRRALDDQSDALAREKLVLAAGIGGKAAAQEWTWIAPSDAPAAALVEKAEAEEAVAESGPEPVCEGPPAWIGMPVELEEATPVDLGRMVRPVLLLLLAVTVVALLLFSQTEAGQAFMDYLRRG